MFATISVVVFILSFAVFVYDLITFIRGIWEK